MGSARRKRRASSARARRLCPILVRDHHGGSLWLDARIACRARSLPARFALPGVAAAQEPAIHRRWRRHPQSLTNARGDATRGRTLVLDRSSTCILCHSGPFPEQKFQGDLAPDLAGSGSRWSEGQLRLRLVDASRLNAETIMPSYYRIDGLTASVRHGRANRSSRLNKSRILGFSGNVARIGFDLMQDEATRRDFLALAGGATMLAVVRCGRREATPATMASAIRNVVGGAASRPARSSSTSALVENGNAVPMTVRVGTRWQPKTTSRASTSSTRRTRSRISATSISAPGRPRPGFDPHPARRHPEDHRDRKALRRHVLVRQRRCRGDACGLHRGASLMASA